MKKDENIDWISKNNSTFKMVNGIPVMINTDKSRNKKMIPKMIDGKYVMAEENFKDKAEAFFSIGFFILAAVLIVGGIIYFFHSSAKGDENNLAAQIKQEEIASTKPQSLPTDWNGQLQEMTTSFNNVQSNNNYSFLYDGCKIEKLPGGGEKLIIYVTDQFTLLTENEKKLYLEQNFKLWAGMAGARQVKFNTDFFEIEMLRKGTMKRLATWDNLFGVSIK